MGMIISSGKVMTQRCWWRYVCWWLSYQNRHTNHIFKIFLTAIAGYIPSMMVHAITAFMDAFYIAHQNAIDTCSLEQLWEAVETYYELHSVFIKAEVCEAISMPCQHTLKHLYHTIQLFGSPNGLCSSITKSKHIQAVKKPWWRSSHYHALTQMLRTLKHMDKMSALHQLLDVQGMLKGFCIGVSSGLVMTCG